MNRKSFIRNTIGAVAAIAVTPYIEPLAAVPVDAPGIGGQLFKLTIKEGWFKPGDIILKNTLNFFTSDASQYYVQRQGDKLIAVDIATGEPKIELVEQGVIEPVTEKYSDITITWKPNPILDPVIDGDYRYDKIANALPELPEPCLEPKFSIMYPNG